MLTAKDNVREVLKKSQGHPDRYVNQWEFLQMVMGPQILSSPMPKYGELAVKNAWGVYYSYPEGTPGTFPLDDPEHVLIDDIEDWKEKLKAPLVEYPDELWNISQGMMDAIDGDKAFKACFVAPGLFEQVHAFCGITDALVYYMTNEDEMHELLKYLKEWELQVAEALCSRLHPDCILHHDDWGSELNSFLRPEMFDEYFTEHYKEIYGYYHDHGVEVIVHHNDSYGRNLVPYMVEMGIDIWQGCMRTNDMRAMVDEFKDEPIVFMGNIDNKLVDHDGWTVQDCIDAAHLGCDDFEPNEYIPSITQGGPGSVYDGTYEELTKAIDQINADKFGHSLEDLENARMPYVKAF